MLMAETSRVGLQRERGDKILSKSLGEVNRKCASTLNKEREHVPPNLIIT
jgi:hypothetical protein